MLNKPKNKMEEGIMKFLTYLVVSLLFLVSVNVFAESVIVTQTSGWGSVPIRVDSVKHTYVIEGTAPTSGDYYYTYSGYRCFREKREVVGVNTVVYRAGVSGGSDIYCYPE